MNYTTKRRVSFSTQTVRVVEDSDSGHSDNEDTANVNTVSTVSTVNATTNTLNLTWELTTPLPPLPPTKIRILPFSSSQQRQQQPLLPSPLPPTPPPPPLQTDAVTAHHWLHHQCTNKSYTTNMSRIPIGHSCPGCSQPAYHVFVYNKHGTAIGDELGRSFLDGRLVPCYLQCCHCGRWEGNATLFAKAYGGNAQLKVENRMVGVDCCGHCVDLAVVGGECARAGPPPPPPPPPVSVQADMDAEGVGNTGGDDGLGDDGLGGDGSGEEDAENNKKEEEEEGSGKDKGQDAEEDSSEKPPACDKCIYYNAFGEAIAYANQSLVKGGPMDLDRKGRILYEGRDSDGSSARRALRKAKKMEEKVKKYREDPDVVDDEDEDEDSETELYASFG